MDRAIAAKMCIKVEGDVNYMYKTVLFGYSLLLSFSLYELTMIIYAKNLIFYYKSLIKGSILQIFGTYKCIFFLTSLAIVLYKISVSKLISYVFLCFFNL